MEFQLLGQIVPKINQDPRFVSWSRLVNFGSLGLFLTIIDQSDLKHRLVNFGSLGLFLT